MSDGQCQTDDCDSPSSKKLKIKHENDNGVSENQVHLKDFVLEKILNNNTNRKTVCIQGKFKDKCGVALVILEKNAFKKEDLDEKGFFCEETELRTFFRNDIYGNFECFPKPSVNGLSIQKKWRNIRDCFVKAHKAKEAKSGSAAKRNNSYVFYDNLIFLKDTVTVNTTTGNVGSESEDGNTAIQNEEILPSNNSRAPKRSKKNNDGLNGKELVKALNRNFERKIIEDDNDRLFFLSLVKEFKKIPDHMQMQSKLDILKVIKDAQDFIYLNTDYPRLNSDQGYQRIHDSGSSYFHPTNFLEVGQRNTHHGHKTYSRTNVNTQPVQSPEFGQETSQENVTSPIKEQSPISIFSDKESVKTTIIYPATDKHITKYSQQEAHIVLETPELYENLTLPFIDKEQFNLQWVYNILEGKSEQERVVYDNRCEKEGFVLVPDLKWDGITKENLYLLAIVRQRGIKSLRDLDDKRLPLLKRIRDEGKKAILDKYKVAGSQLRIYLHYQPSFYHLHVHFTYLRHEAPGIHAEKSHLLDTVIDNIEMMPEYYKKVTLPFTIREMDNIFNIYETNGHVNRTNIGNKELIDK